MIDKKSCHYISILEISQQRVSLMDSLMDVNRFIIFSTYYIKYARFEIDKKESF